MYIANKIKFTQKAVISKELTKSRYPETGHEVLKENHLCQWSTFYHINTDHQCHHNNGYKSHDPHPRPHYPRSFFTRFLIHNLFPGLLPSARDLRCIPLVLFRLLAYLRLRFYPHISSRVSRFDLTILDVKKFKQTRFPVEFRIKLFGRFTILYRINLVKLLFTTAG